jgi:FliI/YscN family ATPase
VSVDLQQAHQTISSALRPVWRGRVDVVSGVMVEATGLRAAQGELCRIDRGELGSMEAEVVGFRGQTTLLMPHGDLAGIAPSQVVTALGRPFSIPVGSSLLGRVVDGFGQPLDGGQPIEAEAESAVRAAAPAPLTRSPIVDVLQTGVRAIDATTTIGRGQRLGIFSGSGVGKSSLLGQITRGTDADIIVCALVGERGREVRHFAEEVLAARGKDKTVMVVATSDRSPIERYLAPFVAVTIAEHFRDRGQNVLLLMDSVTRFAGACREIGLAAGEPPTVRGYPPSFFATVPKLIERMGAGEQGSITGLLTVLLDGDDPNEPVADTLRGLLDGHLLLSRDLAQAGHFPAIDVLKSLSRLMPSLASPDHLELAHLLRSCLAAYEEGRDLVEIGAYKSGANPRLDRAIQLLPAIQAFLQQTADETSALPETLELLALLRGALPQV